MKCLPKMALSVYTFGAPRVGNHGVFTVVPAYNFVAERQSWHDTPFFEPMSVLVCPWTLVQLFMPHLDIPKRDHWLDQRLPHH